MAEAAGGDREARRKRRLAEALRANLRRRKDPPASPESDDALPGAQDTGDVAADARDADGPPLAADQPLR